MGREIEDTNEAASGLRLLDTYYREVPVTRALCFIDPDEPKATRTSPPLPLNASIVDHIAASVAEITSHARATAPRPLTPLPPRVAGIYQWCIDNTTDASPEARLQRDIIIKRQQLEHAIALGEYKVIRPHWCPGCRTLGLRWDLKTRRAQCLNMRCVDRHGMGRSWSLARLATQYVLDQENRTRRAT